LLLVLFVEGKDELGLGRVGAGRFFKVKFLLNLVVFLSKFFLFVVLKEKNFVFFSKFFDLMHVLLKLVFGADYLSVTESFLLSFNKSPYLVFVDVEGIFIINRVKCVLEPHHFFQILDCKEC